MNDSNLLQQIAQGEAHSIMSKRTAYILRNRWLVLLLMAFWIFAVIVSTTVTSVLTKDRLSLGLLFLLLPPSWILYYVIKEQFLGIHEEVKQAIVVLSSNSETYTSDEAEEVYSTYRRASEKPTRMVVLYCLGILIAFAVLAILILGATQF